MTEVQFKIIQQRSLMIAELNKCIGLFVISSHVDRQVREHHEIWIGMRPPSRIAVEQIDINLLHE